MGERPRVAFICLFFCLAFATAAFCEGSFKYDAGSKRDPFIPLVMPDGRVLKLDTEESSNTSLALEGIIYDKQGVSYAVVNGNVVKIGDMVGDYQVLKIEERKVVFIKEGQPFEVELKKEE